MQRIKRLVKHIISRINVNLKPMGLDIEQVLMESIPFDELTKYYAYYALSIDHPLYFRFRESNLGGTYFLGKCDVDRSIVFLSDIRGDELKTKNTKVQFGEVKTELYQDEIIQVINSYLIRTLVHNHSRNPEIPEYFRILNTAAMYYSNIHGTTTEGVYLGAFATADLSVLHNCILGNYAYVQAGDLSRVCIDPGRIWIRQEGKYEFDYRYSPVTIEKYVSWDQNGELTGVFAKFLKGRRSDFLPVYDSLTASENQIHVPNHAFLSRYAVVKGDCIIGENCLVAQRAYIEDSVMGAGANAQENSFIVNTECADLCVVAHGGKMIYTKLGEKVFIGFNCFLQGTVDKKISIGAGSIIMPHTIIDAEEPVTVPEETLVWGYIANQNDLKNQSMSMAEFAKEKRINLGNMSFTGDGAAFIKDFQNRIDHILVENGARYDGKSHSRGHAQKTQSVSYNLFQPYLAGEKEGLFPTIVVEDN
ncbi:hexapeptide repeat-containing transferase [Maridesulfovibrio hydrothermalis]|uniref:Hexapaptide repeat-containing transferase n=1 Tax=Maridesulfovibrio hydrothermalis AM13 = DSM 14728 TaxID=1121451 RepID=L0RGZ7_9BACT|nr:hexapeptide repeat-containing transferase [Maridesulfovibrio hydrothermalis]CCO25512.1 Hexapaptide repeat-containing transferase [Maridesulfovibrio hydrothermalis AM13 = DSM 14728]